MAYPRNDNNLQGHARSAEEATKIHENQDGSLYGLYETSVHELKDSNVYSKDMELLNEKSSKPCSDPSQHAI